MLHGYEERMFYEKIFFKWNEFFDVCHELKSVINRCYHACLSMSHLTAMTHLWQSMFEHLYP